MNREAATPESLPGQRLKDFVGNDSAGSLRILAAGNLAALRRADAYLTAYPQLTGDYIKTATERAAILETERIQLLGPNSAQYSAAKQEAELIFEGYWDVHKKPAAPHNQPKISGALPNFDIPASNAAAAEALLKDLYKINGEKSQQSSTTSA